MGTTPYDGGLTLKHLTGISVWPSPPVFLGRWLGQAHQAHQVLAESQRGKTVVDRRRTTRRATGLSGPGGSAVQWFNGSMVHCRPAPGPVLYHTCYSIKEFPANPSSSSIRSNRTGKQLNPLLEIILLREIGDSDAFRTRLTTSRETKGLSTPTTLSDCCLPNPRTPPTQHNTNTAPPTTTTTAKRLRRRRSKICVGNSKHPPSTLLDNPPNPRTGPIVDKSSRASNRPRHPLASTRPFEVTASASMLWL